MIRIIMCLRCRDVYSLSVEKIKYCSCRETCGVHLSSGYTEFSGKHAIPIELDFHSFKKALRSSSEFSAEFIASVVKSDKFSKINTIEKLENTNLSQYFKETIEKKYNELDQMSSSRKIGRSLIVEKKEKELEDLKKEIDSMIEEKIKTIVG